MHLSKQVATQSSESFNGNTMDSTRNKGCEAIELRNKILPSITNRRSKKK